MTTKHTQGPWNAKDNSWDFSTVYGPNGQAVALCKISDDVTEETQDTLEPIKEANARLIAAAPDLLEACIAIANGYKHKGEEIARAAIAKATGEQA